MKNSLHMTQLRHSGEGRRVAVVEGDQLRLLREFRSVYACAATALKAESRLREIVEADASDILLDYEEIHSGHSKWRMLPAFDHPEDAARCLVTGTGLTHRKSADNRHTMHQSNSQTVPEVTDTLRMYQWGVEGGTPEAGHIGAQPEWFYKGSGEILRAHGESLTVPAFAEDGGEEPEIAVAYLIDEAGQPWRVGFAVGNEFSDHHMEQRNYLYLAHSKLRECAIGPELVVTSTIDDIRGTVRIERDEQTLWSQSISSGEANMVHSLENLEHHHFKYPSHRRPGDAHIHFLGTSGFSFGAGIRLAQGDRMEIAFDGFGRPLRNGIAFAETSSGLAGVKSLS